MKPIPISSPQIDWRERLSVDRVMRSKNLTQGTEVIRLEKQFSKFMNDRDCVAVNSGTSALFLALLALGISKGDEVIVPSFTFAASATAIALTGAKPIFIDINSKTFNLDAGKIEKLISGKTKAIVAVHLYGLPADMFAISKIAEKYSLLIVEDAAQAHLSSIKNQNVGTFGDAAIFSFYPTKNMTSGEGGMIVLGNPALARICRLLRNQGMEEKYKNEIIGFNLRLTEIHAAIGIVQLKKLPKFTQTRINNAKYLASRLDTDDVPFIPSEYKHVFHQFTVKIKNDRATFSRELNDNGVQNSIYYPIPVHRLPAFQRKDKLPETEAACSEVLSLPVHPGLTKKQLNTIIKVFNAQISNNLKR